MRFVGRLMLAIFIVFILISSFATVWAQNSSISVSKSVSSSEFSWEDTVVITLEIENEGENSVNDLTILDYVPDNFEGEPKKLVTNGTINITRTTLLPSEKISYSYAIKGKKDLGTELNVTLRACQVLFRNETGHSNVQMSNDVFVKVNSEKSDTTMDIIQQSFLLLAFSFLFGAFGSFVNFLSDVDLKNVLETAKINGVYTTKDKKPVDAIKFSVPKSVTVNKPFKIDLTITPDSLPEVKANTIYKMEMVLSRGTTFWRKEVAWSKTDKSLSVTFSPDTTGEHSLKCRIIDDANKKLVSTYTTNPVTIDVKKGLAYALLVGGVAGLIILAGLEVLSGTLANKALEITVQTLVTITVSSIAAGFVPTKIIENYTKTLTKEKEETEKESERKDNNLQTANRSANIDNKKRELPK